uniref:WSC domain-containing protein n=1 Tax=Macrostomum lignano TaxID=282301 RepID=A0A1I8GYH3_9PLAT
MQRSVHLTVLLSVPLALLFLVAMSQPSVLHYGYIGCFVDGDNSNRDLKGLTGLKTIGPFTDKINLAYFFNVATVTIESCSSLCALGRFRYFGLQAQGFCFCGNSYGAYGAAANSDCQELCVGNSSQICGGPNRNSIYKNFYAPETGLFKRVASTKSMLTTAPGQPENSTYRSQEATVAFECLAACRHSPDCLACAFVQSSRMCRLMRFAAVPSEVASEAQWVWVKP